MKNVIINSFVFIITFLIIGCNKNRKNIENINKKTYVENDTVKLNKYVIESSGNYLNDSTFLLSYTIKDKKFKYLTKFSVVQSVGNDNHGFGLNFGYYDFDELIRIGVINQHVEIDEQAFYFKIINNQITIKRFIEQTHWQGRNYMHQLCVKRCNIIVKENDTINWDDFFYKHFQDKDGNPKKYCRDVITDSIEWEEYKPR
jgi:hypothetical protein